MVATMIKDMDKTKHSLNSHLRPFGLWPPKILFFTGHINFNKTLVLKAGFDKLILSDVRQSMLSQQSMFINFCQRI